VGTNGAGGCDRPDGCVIPAGRSTRRCCVWTGGWQRARSVRTHPRSDPRSRGTPPRAHCPRSPASGPAPEQPRRAGGGPGSGSPSVARERRSRAPCVTARRSSPEHDVGARAGIPIALRRRAGRRRRGSARQDHSPVPCDEKSGGWLRRRLVSGSRSVTTGIDRDPPGPAGASRPRGAGVGPAGRGSSCRSRTCRAR